MIYSGKQTVLSFPIIPYYLSIPLSLFTSNRTGPNHHFTQHRFFYNMRRVYIPHYPEDVASLNTPSEPYLEFRRFLENFPDEWRENAEAIAEAGIERGYSAIDGHAGV